jgi:tight adherence protein B
MSGYLTFGSGILIYVGIFLGVLLTFDGLWQLVSRRPEGPGLARNRRMKMIAGGATTVEVLDLLKRGATSWRLKSLPFVGTLPEDLRGAGLALSPVSFLAAGLATMAVIGAAAAPRLGVGPAFGIGLALGVLLPVMILRKKRDTRMKLMIAQLPDALDLMSRGLRVGHPLNTTIAAAAEEMADPLASELGLIVDQISYGDDLVSAFHDFAERVNLEDARYLATAVAIQNGTGGDLGRVLMTLSKVIRGRIIMRKRILAISSEGRMTAMFMSCLPFFIFGSTTITTPDYYLGVADQPLFRTFATIVVVLVVGNFLAMRRLVNFRI